MKPIVFIYVFCFLIAGSFQSLSQDQYISFFYSAGVGNWPNGTTSASNLRSDASNIVSDGNYTGCVYADVVMGGGPWKTGGYPRYSLNGGTTTYGFGMDMFVEWTNCTSSATMTITFKNASGGAVTAYPVSFSILGLNSHPCGTTAAQRFIDKVKIEGFQANLTTPVTPTVTKVCANAVQAGNVVTGTQSCGTGNTANAVNVSFSSVAKIVITYSSGIGDPPSLTCGGSPAPLVSTDDPMAQNIYISAFKISAGSAPTAITASDNTICPGENVTLTVSGGSASSKWYTGSCGGTLIGTGSSINVAPNTTTTYWVANPSLCGITTCATSTITVTQPSTVGLATGEWVFFGTLNNNWEEGGNWRVWNGTQFTAPASHPTTTSDVRLRSGTCLMQPTVNSINQTSTNNTNLTGAATCRNITIESTGILTINPDADIEHFHILGDYFNSGTVNYANGRFKFVKNGTQTLRDANTGTTATFYEMDIESTSVTQLINSTNVTILNALRIKGVVQTNGNLFWLNTTSIDGVNTGVVNGAYTGHIFGTFRRTIQNNNATYRFPVGVTATLNTGRRLMEYINNGVVGPSHLDCFASYPFKGSGNNVDSQLDPAKSTEWGQFLNFVHPEAVWTLTPGAAFTSGSYGVRLYVQNFISPVPQDNKFAVLKRPTGSTTFFDFNAYDNSTTIPNGGLPGRVYASGNGYAEKLGFTQFSEFVIASAPLPLSVELKEFALNCNSDNAILSWSTASEFNNDYYTVERSTTGSDFELISKVDGHGSTGNEQKYIFTDKDPKRGVSYYRLTQVDFDGQQEVLGVLSTEWPCKNPSNEVLIFPNPTDGDVNLVITNDDRENYSVEIFDAIGQLVIPVMDEKIEQQGTIMLKVKTSDLAAGIFLMRVVVGERVYTEKLIIKK